MTRAPTGHALGRKIGDMLGEQVVKARHATSRMESDAVAKRQRDMMEHLERELAPSMRAILGHVADDPNTPDEMRAYFREITNPSHQSTFFLMLAAFLGIGISGPGAAAAGLLQRLQADSLAKWGDVPLTPQEAATGVVKGHVDEATARELAGKAGVHRANFDRMVEITGNPPGPETLLTMLNRGVIDEARFGEGIRQGLIRTEWSDEILKLRFAPMSVPEAIAAEVEGHIDAGIAKSLMFDNGINEIWHDILYDTAGEPPGIVEMLQLFRRGLIDRATMEQAIRESRIKNKYIPAILEMARRLMPERTIVSGISKGVLTHQQGIAKLLELGFNTEDATALAAEAKSVKLAKHKEIAESQVLAAYEDGVIGHTEAVTMIGKLGYDQTEAEFVLHLADDRKEIKFRNAAIARVHTLYVSHHIDMAKASNTLDGIGVHPDMKGQLLKLWDLERGANVPRLTVAEQQGLYKRGIINTTELLRRFKTYGYTDADAQALVELTVPAPRGGRAPTGP